MNDGKILMIDDDEDVLLAAKMLLKKHIYQVIIERNPNKIPFLLNNDVYDVILLDVKDLLSLTASGVVDIGSVMPSYASEKMPLTAVAELPCGFATSCEGTLAYWKLARDGLLAQKEFAPNGVRALFVLVSVPYQVLMKQKFESIKQLEGRKLRSIGAASDAAIRKLNAVPIRMPAPEIYESLSRGTLDGVVVSYAAAVSYNLHTLTKAVTAGENFSSAVLTYSIGEARWMSLPSIVQQAMVEAGDKKEELQHQFIDLIFNDEPSS